MSEAADHGGAARVARNRSSHGAHDHSDWHSGPLRQRSGRRVFRGIHAGILETEAGKVGPLQRLSWRGGESNISIFFFMRIMID